MSKYIVTWPGGIVAKMTAKSVASSLAAHSANADDHPLYVVTGHSRQEYLDALLSAERVDGNEQHTTFPLRRRQDARVSPGEPSSIP